MRRYQLKRLGGEQRCRLLYLTQRLAEPFEQSTGVIFQSYLLKALLESGDATAIVILLPDDVTTEAANLGLLCYHYTNWGIILRLPRFIELE